MPKNKPSPEQPKPCPWCGGPMKSHRWYPAGNHAVYFHCINPKCPVVPATKSRATRAEALRLCNDRKGE